MSPLTDEQRDQIGRFATIRAIFGFVFWQSLGNVLSRLAAKKSKTTEVTWKAFDGAVTCREFSGPNASSELDRLKSKVVERFKSYQMV